MVLTGPHVPPHAPHAHPHAPHGLLTRILTHPHAEGITAGQSLTLSSRFLTLSSRFSPPL